MPDHVSHSEPGPLSGGRVPAAWDHGRVTGALGESTWPEVAERGPSVLAVPLGSVEQHGPHLPLDTDSRIAEALVAALSRGARRRRGRPSPRLRRLG